MCVNPGVHWRPANPKKLAKSHSGHQDQHENGECVTPCYEEEQLAEVEYWDCIKKRRKQEEKYKMKKPVTRNTKLEN